MRLVHWKNDQTLGELMKDLLTRAPLTRTAACRAGGTWKPSSSRCLTENDFNNTKGKLKMKTKSQLSKNVTMNKPDEKRQGMKVRTVVTGHDDKGRAGFLRDVKVDGTPITSLGAHAFL